MHLMHDIFYPNCILSKTQKKNVIDFDSYFKCGYHIRFFFAPNSCVLVLSLSHHRHPQTPGCTKPTKLIRFIIICFIWKVSYHQIKGAKTEQSIQCWNRSLKRTIAKPSAARSEFWLKDRKTPWKAKMEEEGKESTGKLDNFISTEEEKALDCRRFVSFGKQAREFVWDMLNVLLCDFFSTF